MSVRGTLIYGRSKEISEETICHTLSDGPLCNSDVVLKDMGQTSVTGT